MAGPVQRKALAADTTGNRASQRKVVQRQGRTYKPPSGTPPRIPPDIRVVDIDTSGLYDLIAGLDWSTAGRDATWSGFSMMRRICSTAYWRSASRLTDGISQTLTYSTTLMHDTYRLEIIPEMTACPPSTTRGGSYSDQASGGSEVVASDSATNSFGSNVGNASLNAGGDTSNATGQGTQDVSASQQGSSSPTSIQFTAAVKFKVRLFSELGGSTFGNIVSLGVGELVSELAESGPQNRTLSGKTLTFTLPPERVQSVD
ncbi:MAG: hypothetical protein MJE77_18505 [Proteobacteria bacterium]|nr:hypothetical protein [Pseudomonadota bacterium]